jgi:hypothetical protein
MPKVFSIPSPDGEAVSHDKLFRTLFEHFFQDLIEILNQDLANTLDFKTVRFIPREHFQKLSKDGQVIPDILAEIRTKGGEEQIVLVDVEIEASYTSIMEKRLWHYARHLSATWKKPVFSAVVYLTGGPPNVEIHEVTENIGPWVAGTFRYISLGLSRSLAEDWLKRPQPLAAALAARMRSEIWSQLEKKIACMERIARSDLDPTGNYMLANTVESYVQLSNEDTTRYTDWARCGASEEAKDMVITWEEALQVTADRAEARGETRGEARGETRGEARGKLDATRQAIVLLAEKRPDLPLPDDFVARLDAIADLPRLHEILELILDVRNFDELGLAKPPEKGP